VLERPEVCTNSFLKILNVYKSKHKNREAIEVYKIVQSNSSITINPINENLPVHDTIYSYNENEEDYRDNEKLFGFKKQIGFYHELANKPPKKNPPVEAHSMIRTYTVFCEKLAIKVLPPNISNVENFLNWLCTAMNYLTSTIVNARFILQDYFRENGYEFTGAGKMRLAENIKQIKKNHHIKEQGSGVNPMMVDDLEHILTSIPKSYHLKDSMASLFLMSFNTAQRASTCVSVLFEDINVIMDPQALDQVKFIQLTFNKMKGIRGDAKIKKTICKNEKNEQICFIRTFEKYTKSKYNIDIKDFNKIKKDESGKKRRYGS
jgi:hypothetical protein